MKGHETNMIRQTFQKQKSNISSPACVSPGGLGPLGPAGGGPVGPGGGPGGPGGGEEKLVETWEGELER